MSDYRISNSMYKRIQDRKSKMLLYLFIAAVIQICIIAICVVCGRDGVILGCVLEPLFIYLLYKLLRNGIRSMTYKNRTGRVLACDVDRYIDRSISNGGERGRGARYNFRAKANFTLYVEVAENKIVCVPIPDRDAYLSYQKDDEVMLISYLPYPVIISRSPKRAICPQCGRLLHYEDGACHHCGLSDIYPNYPDIS